MEDFANVLFTSIDKIEKKALLKKRLPRFKSNQFLFRTTLTFEIPLHYKCSYNGLFCHKMHHMTSHKVTICARRTINRNCIFDGKNDRSCNTENLYCIKCWWNSNFLKYLTE